MNERVAGSYIYAELLNLELTSVLATEWATITERTEDFGAPEVLNLGALVVTNTTWVNAGDMKVVIRPTSEVVQRSNTSVTTTAWVQYSILTYSNYKPEVINNQITSIVSTTWS